MCRKAEVRDVAGWIKQVERIKDHFPGYDREEYKEEVMRRIKSEEAFVKDIDGKIAGVVLFSREEREILFLAVFPPYRKKGIGHDLVLRVLEEFHEGVEISVMTYRAGDPLGEVARAFYSALGFEAKELLDVFDYPCQRLVYIIK